MDFECITTDAQQQNDEFDIDLRLGASQEPGEMSQVATALCTNSSTCSHTTPRLCC